MIRQIMQMPLFIILNFLNMVFVIFSLIYSIMIMIFPLVILLSHRSLIIHLLMNWNFPKPSRHFSPSLFLCQVLIVLRSVSLWIRNMLNLSKLLITLSYTLKINLFYNFCIIHLYNMILSLSHWKSHMWQVWLQRNISCFFMFTHFGSLRLFSCMYSSHSVSTHHHAPSKCLPCACISFFSTRSFKLQTFWFALSYLFCLFLCFYIFLDMHSLTYIGKAMCQWFHWKYHFMWVYHIHC